MIPKITLTDAPTPEMRKAIAEPLIEFNDSGIGKPFGILHDCPPGHSRFYLTKRLGSG